MRLIHPARPSSARSSTDAPVLVRGREWTMEESQSLGIVASPAAPTQLSRLLPDEWCRADDEHRAVIQRASAAAAQATLNPRIEAQFFHD